MIPGTTSNADAVGRKRVDLLAAAAEDERIAAFETQHALARERALDQERVDRFLAHRVIGPPLADVDALRARRQEREDLGRYQVVVERDVGAPHELPRPHGKEVRVSRTRAHQVDLAASRARGNGGSGPLGFLPDHRGMQRRARLRASARG